MLIKEQNLMRITSKTAPVHSLSDTCKANCDSSMIWVLRIIGKKILNALKRKTGT